MNKELTTTLENIRKLQDSQFDHAPHFLLGYLWASLSEAKRKEIAKRFANQLKEKDWNK